MTTPTLEYSSLRTAAAARRRGERLNALVNWFENLPELDATFGRKAQSEYVQQIASRLRNSARPAILFGRWLDDRFVQVLPDAGRDGDLLVKARIRRAIADQLTRPAAAGRFTVRAVAAWFAFPPDRPPDLMAATERALAAEKYLRRTT